MSCPRSCGTPYIFPVALHVFFFPSKHTSWCRICMLHVRPKRKWFSVRANLNHVQHHILRGQIFALAGRSAWADGDSEAFEVDLACKAVCISGYLLVILCVSLLRLERAAFYLFRLFCLCSSSLRRLIPWRLPLLTPQRKNTIILSIAVKECPNGRTNTIALIFALHMPIVKWFLVPLDVAVACCSCSCASCLCTVPQHPLACKSQIYRSTADLL